MNMNSNNNSLNQSFNTASLTSSLDSNHSDLPQFPTNGLIGNRFSISSKNRDLTTSEEEDNNNTLEYNTDYGSIVTDDRLRMDIDKLKGELELKFDIDFTSSHQWEEIMMGDDMEMELKQYEMQDKIIEDALRKGIDITQFSEEVDDALRRYSNEISELYQQSIPDYVLERETFATMYQTIKSSGELLNGFEEMLQKFHSELTNISKEMRSLQELSITQHAKCSNRKQVVEKLNKIIDEVNIADDLVVLLSQGEVNDQYLQYLSLFSRKLGSIRSMKSGSVYAAKEVEDSAVRLLNKVLEKVYKFFITQFNHISNFNCLQSKQQELTLYRQAFIFIYKNTRNIARQLYEQYKDITERIYSSYIKSYIVFLEKLQMEATSRNDLIAIPESKTKGFFSSKSNKLQVKTSIYTVESRIQILSELDLPALNQQSLSSGTSAVTNQIKYPYEVIFRSLIFFIIDLVAFENMFVKDYFLSNQDSSPFTFGKSEQMFIENLSSYLGSTYDLVALLLVVCITGKYRMKMTSKSIIVVDNMFKQVLDLTNRRIQMLFDENLESIRNASIKDLGPIEENRTHYIIRRYSELIGSISILFEYIPVETQPIIIESTAIMRVEMSKLINKLSEEIKDRICRYIFLLNNYDLILTILVDKLNVSNDDKDFWLVLYEKESEQYSMEQLMSFPYFKRVMMIVKELFPLINLYTPEEINHPQLKKEIHESILKDFSQNWRSGIEEMNVIVTQQFPNFKNGMKIFQRILDQLFNNYKQFTQIVLKYFKSLKNSQYFIPETEISYEIKKYYVSFD
ncbi:Vps52 / Sac2 family protein [Tieghemostelium lacteum]|uniref:Vps52 / Sac2 family protein n=1 Tax=Tieghemostelium lacteum TaxID=361077 RepID=A0A151ZAR7_TIELA|nr:Vps52 / Sac2 family protein [Tieghemostelium lacteum]|eukprot:KYQ91031.1 Vps52 / Sac2 family protein [Tieghemostelium lacteum]